MLACKEDGHEKFAADNFMICKSYHYLIMHFTENLQGLVVNKDCKYSFLNNVSRATT